ncbi:MAG: T9SS type A sorting domain-containing protein [Ignavibacteria bacterium]|nr:T9SS type A sorting domain-containing protein [Ignavibacteria bacterium]
MHLLLFGRKHQQLLFPSLLTVFFIFCLYSALVPRVSAQGLASSEVGGNGRDFRSRQSGNWSDPATWQVFRSGVWVNADAVGGLIPTAQSNVFIEGRHIISATRASVGTSTFDGKTENAFVECNNLSMSNTFATVTTTWAGFDMSRARTYPAHELRIYGKLRAYTGDAVNRTDVSVPTTLRSDAIGAGSTLVFRGASRIITQPQQWSTTEAPVYADAARAGQNGFFTAIFELGVMPSGDVTNLDDDPSGAVGTIQGNFVAGHIIVKRGTVRVEGASFLANEGYTTSGTIQVMNNAVLQFSIGSIIARTILPTNVPGPPFTPASRLRSFVVEDGGAVEFTNAVGTINAADVRFNGTVIYSRTGDQTLLQRSELLPSGENGDANDPYPLSSAVENYSSLTLRGSGLKTFPPNITVSRVLLLQGTAKATGQQVRFLRSTNVADAVWSVNGGNTARIVNLGFRTASLLGGITLSRSTNREQIDLTPPQTPLVDAALQSASNLIVAAPNTPYDTPINTSATTTLQYDSEQSDTMDNIEFPSGVQGPHNLVINVNSNVTQVIKASTMVIQGPEYTASLNGHLPRVINSGVAASAFVDTRPNLTDSRSVTAEGLIPAALANGGLRPLVPIPFATSDGRVRRFEDGGRRGDINNFGVIELRRGNLNLRNIAGSTLTLSTTAIISPDMSKARNPQAGSDDATQKRGPAGPGNLTGSLVGGSLASLVFNGGTALYPVQDNFNTGFTEIGAPIGVRGTTGYAPSTSTGRFNFGPEVVSTVDADGTVRRANNSYNVDLPYIRSGVEHITMIRATSNVLTLLGNQENTGNGITFSSPELSGLQVYGTIATARGSIDLNGRNIEMGGNNSNLVEAYSKVQITDPATGRTLGTFTPFSSRASTVRNTNSAKAYIGLTSPRNVITANAPIGIDAVNEDVGGLGMQIYQNGNPLQLRIRRWQTNKDNTIQLGQGIQAANRYYEIEKSGTLVQQITRSDARFQYVEEDLNGAPEDSLLLLRSGTMNSSWTAIDNARSVIRLDPAQFMNQLTAKERASTLNFEDATARYWAIGASVRSTSVRLREETARAVALAACYPNPTQDVAYFRYVVRETVPLEITLYDLTGRKLATLLQSVHSTGDYTLEVRTEHLSSGAYMIRLQTPNTTTQELLRVVK